MQESNKVYLMSKASVAVSNCSRIWKIPGSSRLGGSAFTMLSSNLADEKRKNGGYECLWDKLIGYILKLPKKGIQTLTS